MSGGSDEARAASSLENGAAAPAQAEPARAVQPCPQRAPHRVRGSAAAKKHARLMRMQKMLKAAAVRPLVSAR
eukprot:13479942-Alexandrium_andersonii.AAC.1